VTRLCGLEGRKGGEGRVAGGGAGGGRAVEAGGGKKAALGERDDRRQDNNTCVQRGRHAVFHRCSAK